MSRCVTKRSASARLPSVLDLARSGSIFRLGATAVNPSVRGFDPTPDTVQLLFSDMLVHAPGEVYPAFERGGIPYLARNIDFGTGSRICFINRCASLSSRAAPCPPRCTLMPAAVRADARRGAR